MQITPDELTASGYVLLDRLGHKELIPFVRTYLKKRTRYSFLYTIWNVLSLALIALFVWMEYYFSDFHIGRMFTYFSYGIGIAFLLVPVHEYIHVLAYKTQGAATTSYDVNLKKFYFMALADKFVASRREFIIVALAPIIGISLILVLLLPFVDYPWVYTILGVLMTHTAFSSGDFGLLSYFDFHHEKEVVTYDDKASGISYFYGKKKE